VTSAKPSGKRFTDNSSASGIPFAAAVPDVAQRALLIARMKPSPSQGNVSLDPATLAAPEKSETDPVCGMKVAPNPGKSVEHESRRYYFCSARCIEKFRSNPSQYVAVHPKAAEAPPSKRTIYTCPMHPEVRQIGPGNCPICGMAMEPLDASAGGDDGELRDMTRR
jgi:YHS domain-containing protein